MAWPNPNEYVEAIQHPQQAFADPDLRGGKVITNKLGLPRPISGNFATVFEVKNDSSRWAVRCFLREVTNQQQRYAAIAAHLKQHALPCMVNFEYLPEGIRVRGKWYPILKMDWTAGIRLDTYIEDHLGSPHDLQQLAERWVTLCHSLRQAQIAHGDLQHGNILINERDEIKLIDYDGMIVPDVVGLDNNEIGHRHYQHPSRKTDAGITRGNFDRVDNFSCHVIGLSLMALAMDAALWKETQAGEENLLFRDADYLSPETSKTFARLAKHEDQRVRAVGQVMLEAVRTPAYLDVPPFEHDLAPMQTRFGQVKSWLIHQIAPDVDAPLPESVTQAAGSASWIFDHVEAPQPPPLDFSADFILHERIGVEVEFQRSPFGAVQQLFPAYAIVQLVRRYPNYAIVQEKQNVKRAGKVLEQQLLEAKARRKTLSRMIVEIDRRYQQEVRTLEGQIAELDSDLERSRQQEAREVIRLERALQNALEQGQAASGTLITADDVTGVQKRYADAQRDLEDQRKNLQRRLDKIRANSDELRLQENLRDELDSIEAEVTTLQDQTARVWRERGRYDLITLRRFLARIAATAPF